MKKAKSLPDEYVDDFKRFFEYMPSSGELDLILLKSHLLIKELLREIIKKKFYGHNSVEKANLSFYQCLCLASAFHDKEHLNWLWKAVEKINILRNKMAHNLDPVGFSDSVAEFINFVETNFEEIPGNLVNNKMTKFHWTLSVTHMSLSALLRVKYKDILEGKYNT